MRIINKIKRYYNIFKILNKYNFDIIDNHMFFKSKTELLKFIDKSIGKDFDNIVQFSVSCDGIEILYYKSNR